MQRLKVRLLLIHGPGRTFGGSQVRPGRTREQRLTLVLSRPAIHSAAGLLLALAAEKEAPRPAFSPPSLRRREQLLPITFTEFVPQSGQRPQCRPSAGGIG